MHAGWILAFWYLGWTGRCENKHFAFFLWNVSRPLRPVIHFTLYFTSLLDFTKKLVSNIKSHDDKKVNFPWNYPSCDLAITSKYNTSVEAWLHENSFVFGIQQTLKQFPLDVWKSTDMGKSAACHSGSLFINKAKIEILMHLNFCNRLWVIEYLSTSS